MINLKAAGNPTVTVDLEWLEKSLYLIRCAQHASKDGVTYRPQELERICKTILEGQTEIKC